MIMKYVKAGDLRPGDTFADGHKVTHVKTLEPGKTIFPGRTIRVHTTDGDAENTLHLDPTHSMAVTRR